MGNNRSKAGRQQFWQDHLAKWNATELSQVEYCGRNRISLKSFQYWKRKTKQNSGVPALVELTLPKSLPVPLLSSHPQLCLVVGQRYRVEIGKGFDSEDLERVVRVLEQI
jgi:hypothetical protein